MNDVRGLRDAGAEPGFSDQAGPGALKAGAQLPRAWEPNKGCGWRMGSGLVGLCLRSASRENDSSRGIRGGQWGRQEAKAR